MVPRATGLTVSGLDHGNPVPLTRPPYLKDQANSIHSTEQSWRMFKSRRRASAPNSPCFDVVRIGAAGSIGLSRMNDVIPAISQSDLLAVRRLFEQYAASLGVDLGFQHFARELSSLPADYCAPRGALERSGAGDGNRTHLAGLGSRCITTMLRPHSDVAVFSPFRRANQAKVGKPAWVLIMVLVMAPPTETGNPASLSSEETETKDELSSPGT